MCDVEKDCPEILTPSFHGEKCRHSGDQVGFELACDECDFYLVCFPDWKENSGLEPAPVSDKKEPESYVLKSV